MKKDVQRVAIVDPSDSTRESLRNLLLGIDTVWLEAECARYEFFWELINQSNPDVAIISLDHDPARALQLIAQLSMDVPHLAVLAVSSRTDGPFILQTLRTGAKEFLTQPLVLEELLTAVNRVRSQSRSSSPDINGMPGRVASTVIAVTGSRGGVGSTTVAVNVATSLAQDKHNSVVLIDLDLALGDADVALDVMPSYTLADVVMNIDRLDMTFLRGSLSKHSTGLALLPHPVQLDDASLIQEEHLERLLGLLRATYTHVVLDLSKSFRPTDITAMKLADTILMVAQLELSSIRNVVRLLMSINGDEGMSERVKVVLNRVGADEQEITQKKAEETMNKAVFWQVPNDSRNVLTSRNAGVPLVQYAPRSKAAHSLSGLAAALDGRGYEVAGKKEKKGFLFF
jgi:pilus assembly protein CpaE